MGNPCINVYADRDGRWFWIVGLEGERHWPPLARAVGRPEWLTDPRFATPAERAKHAAALIAELDAVFATKPLAEWRPIFDATEDFWWSPVQNLEEVMADPQVRAAGGFVEVPDGDATTLLPNTPADFHGTPASPRWMAPSLGQHSDEVLRELGKDEAERKALFEKGVVIG
jgi:crotonobetainyl-CoA:carnitine CoA-transferase CaiB-like acyl-CoA transferase